MEMSSADFIKELVQRGEGISFLMYESVSAELKAGKLVTVPLKGCRARIDVHIAYLKDEPLTPPAEAFRNFLMQLTAAFDRPQRINTLKNTNFNKIR